VRDAETTARSAQLDMNDALKDLDALMVKAREMVRLAGELNERLTVTELNASSGGGGAEPETATFIRSSLAQLGLRMTDAPVTLDMTRDESSGTSNLRASSPPCCRALVGRSGPGMMGNRGIIPLDEVWGGWNRVRGVGKCFVVVFLFRFRYLWSSRALKKHMHLQPS
jgi:ESCRT-II complex subunit VPS36